MTPARLGRLHFMGITSLRDVELDLSTDVTVLIGANGSGKSNLVGALELVSRILARQLQETLLQRGGFDRLLHMTPSPENRPERIQLEVWSEPGSGAVRNGYRATLAPAEGDEAVLNEHVLIHDTARYRRPFDDPLGASRESQLSGRLDDERLERFATHIRPLLQGIRVYHFDDVSATAPTKKLRSIDDDVSLHPDAGNIAPYLLRLSRENPDAYARIRTVVRNVAPFFEDFVLRPETSGNIRLRWRQQGLGDAVLGAGQISDGTLRFICLATLLLSPDAPQVIVLDEPELGLHPFAITQLAALIEQATVDGRQVIVATQSALLLDEFPVESVALLDRRGGATVVGRPDATGLKAFLDEYSLSELWQMNVLSGGQPSWGDGRA